MCIYESIEILYCNSGKFGSIYILYRYIYIQPRDEIPLEIARPCYTKRCIPTVNILSLGMSLDSDAIQIQTPLNFTLCFVFLLPQFFNCEFYLHKCHWAYTYCKLLQTFCVKAMVQ